MIKKSILTVSDRAALKPRREPYWEQLARGQHLGYRKSSKQTPGTWIARFTTPGTYKVVTHPLGDFAALPASQRRDGATEMARAWFKHIHDGGSPESKTVEDACNHYVEHLRVTKGTKAADDAETRFRRYVLDDRKFASIQLAKLTPALIGEWRKRIESMPKAKGIRGKSRFEQAAKGDVDISGAKRSPGTINRDMTPFRAALNLAHKDEWIGRDSAWRNKLRPIPTADKKRELYLDIDQRRAIVNHAGPAIKEFIQGLCILPLRPGALAELRACDFDKRLNQLTVNHDKTGSRRLTLPAETSEFIKRMAGDKIGNAYIFSSSDGKAWNKDKWKGPIHEAVLAASAASSLPSNATAYTFRHSVITDLVHQGLDLLSVAQLAGTSVRMIEQHYGHLRATIALPALAALVI
jgi:hypothetical protein